MKASPGLIAAIGAGILLIFAAMTYMGAANYANGAEKGIKFSHEQSQNVFGQYAPKIKDALGVTKIQTGAVVEVITAANETRYGKTGSEATMQWITEQNPNLDQASYGKIINLIDAGRTDFANAQKEKLDRIRAYETALGNMPGSWFMGMAGYPTQAYTSAHYEKIVISDHAAEAFTTGRDNGLNLGQ